MTAQPAQKQFLPTVQRSATAVLSPIQREFNRLFDELSAGWNALAEFDVAPRMDMRETKDAVELSFELPGIAQEDIKIDFEDDVLTVSGEKKVEQERQDDNYRIAERSYGSFSRSVLLPRSVDAEQIKATMTDGVLKISAPKINGAATKTIKIETAKSA